MYRGRPTWATINLLRSNLRQVDYHMEFQQAQMV